MTDTLGTNVQNNDTPITQQDTIGAGFWQVYASLACRSYPCSPLASTDILIVCHSSFYSGQNDLPRPPSIWAPVSSNRLHPEDQRKQSRLTGRCAASHGPSSLARHGGSTSDSQAKAEEFHTAPHAMHSEGEKVLCHHQEVPHNVELEWAWSFLARS